MDTKFAGLSLKFNLTAYFSDFYNSQVAGQPKQSYTLTVNIQNSDECIDSTYLAGAQIENINAVILQQSSVTLSYLVQINATQTLQYQISNLPTCLGYQLSGTVQYSATIVSQSGSIITFGVDQSTFSSCVTLATTDCFYHNTETQTLSWYLFDKTYVGTNIVYIVPTLFAVDLYGDSLNLTYTNSNSGSFKLQVTFNTACLKNSDLLGATFQTLNYNYTVFTNLQQSYTYSIQNQPTCIGYQAVDTQYVAYLISNDSVTYQFQTSQTVYDACVTSATSSCLYQNQATNTLYWYLFEALLWGENTVYIVPTLYALDYYGNSLSLVYTQTQAGSFNLNVTWITCMTTQFQTPTQILVGLTQQGMPSFTTAVKDFILVNSTNLMDNSNFDFKQNLIQVSDTYSDIRKVSSWCGQRVFLLSVASSETNILASALLSQNCTSCLTVSSVDGYQANLKLRIMDDYYENTTLMFTLSTYLLKYYNQPTASDLNHQYSTLGQPTNNYDFYVTSTQCAVKYITLSPTTDQSYQYSIAQNMTALIFTVTRVPNCIAFGSISLTVNGTNISQPDTQYGINAVQSTDSTNTVTTIQLFSYYELNTWLNKTLVINMNYTISGKIYKFGKINAKYSCQVSNVQLSPSNPLSFNYTIGSLMTPLQLQVKRIPSCPSQLGEISLEVSGASSTEGSLSNYGILTSQTTELTGTTTSILVNCNYQSSDLAGQTLTIILSYKIGNNTFTFQPITANYLNSTQKTSVTASGPVLSQALPVSPTIPCLKTAEAKSWSYVLPQATESSGQKIQYSISCESLKSLLVFTAETLTISLNINANQPNSAIYKGTLTLTDTSLNSNSYSLNFNVSCQSSNSLGQGQSNFGQQLVGSGGGTQQTQPPKPVISSISNDGQIYIIWSQPMFTTPFNGQVNSTRLLQSNQNQQAISLKYIQNSDQSQIKASQLTFNYSISWKNNLNTIIKVTFNQPQYVSADIKHQDQVVVSFNNPSFFQSYPDGLQMNSNVSITMKMPKQKPISSVSINKKALQDAGIATVGVSFALSFVLSAVLNQVLSIISDLTIILHMFILSLNYPANVQDFFAAFFPIVTFNLFPINLLYEPMFQINEINDWALSDQFSSVGYGNTLIIFNMGTLYMSFVITPAITLILFFMKKFMPIWRCSKCGREKIEPRVNNYLKQLFWNGIIQFLDQNYLILTCMSMIAMTDLRLDSTLYSVSEVYQSVLAIIILVVVLILPIAIAIIYWVKIKSSLPLPSLDDNMQIETLWYLYKTINIKKIENEIYTIEQHQNFLEKWGVLLQKFDLQILGKGLTILTVLIPFFRRLIFITSIIVFLNTPIFSILVFNYVILFYIIYIEQFHPDRGIQDQRKHILSEYILLIVNYHLFMFTDFTNVDQQTVVGNSIIYFVMGQLGLMVLLAVVPMVREWKYKYLLKKKKKAKAKKLKQKQEKAERKGLEQEAMLENETAKLDKTNFEKSDLNFNLDEQEHELIKATQTNYLPLDESEKVRVFPEPQSEKQQVQLWNNKRRRVIEKNQDENIKQQQHIKQDQEKINLNHQDQILNPQSNSNVTVLKLSARTKVRQRRIQLWEDQDDIQNQLAKIDSVGSKLELSSQVNKVDDQEYNKTNIYGDMDQTKRLRLQRQIYFNDDDVQTDQFQD